MKTVPNGAKAIAIHLSSRPRDITATPMPAHRDAWEERLLADPVRLLEIADEVGGHPFHLLYPERVARNIRAFHDEFAQAGVRGVIYYGKKANKAACVVDECRKNDAGVDVSSIQELRAALASGVDGGLLVVTGPSKSEELLRLATDVGALIAVDAEDELERLIGLGCARRARVLLRVQPPGSYSRFGMSFELLEWAIDMLVGEPSIELEGFSFHLSGYKYRERARLAAQLVDWSLRARRLGHPITTISIGGGFGVDYVPKEAWKTFVSEANPRWFHAGEAPALHSYYPYHFEAPGPKMLANILAHDDLAARLRADDLTVAIEPGRSLLDRAGSTVFRVQGVKNLYTEGHPYLMLTANGTSLSLSEQWFNSEYLPDPVLWPPGSGTVTPTCVGGASCLESDMLSRRRIPLPRAAVVGDLLVYPNTAGYQMDSNESAFHQLPIPPKVVLRNNPDNSGFEWALDS